MRYIKNIIMLVASVFIFASCELKIEEAFLDTEDKFVVPVLISPGNIVIDQDNIKEENVVYNWSSASFGPEVQVEYILYGTYGELTSRLGSSYSNTLTIPKEDLNGIVCNSLEVPKNQTREISTYLVAKIYQTNVTEQKSNLVAYNVTTFEAPLRWYYLPGAYSTWGATDGNKFWETEGGSDIYQTLVDMKVSPPGKSEFKVITQDGNTWLGADVIKPSWDESQIKDNIFVNTTAESSIFLFSFNINSSNSGTVDKTDFASVNIVGKFEGWGTTPVNMIYDAATNIWSSTRIDFATADQGGLEFVVRLGNDWENKYGDSKKESEVVLNGLNLLKGGANMTVPSIGTYIMKLHANRTPFVLVMEKQ